MCLKNEVGRSRLPFAPSYNPPMEFSYDKIHRDLPVPKLKSRAKKIAKAGILDDYVTPIGEALLEQDDERFAFYVLEAAEWVRQVEEHW